MPRTRVKICGVMRPQDAADASLLGSDAVGMIFHPAARRFISTDLARQIVARIGPFVTPIGVFVDADAQHIVNVAAEVGLRVVQLHGDEPPEQVAALGNQGLKIIKAIRVDQNLESTLAKWRAAMNELNGTLLGLVLETANQQGGSGVANDWNAVREHQSKGHFAGLPLLIASGGLNELNVAEVVRNVRPWAADVSSGVEESLGKKSPAKMEAFIAAARNS